MTFNILAFITIHVYLSSENTLAKSKVDLVDLTQNDPASIIHYVSEQNKPFKLIPEPIFSQLFDQFKYPTQE